MTFGRPRGYYEEVAIDCVYPQAIASALATARLIFDVTDNFHHPQVSSGYRDSTEGPQWLELRGGRRSLLPRRR